MDIDHMSVEEEDLDLSKPEVVDKYREAANIVNAALQVVVAQLVPGKQIVEVCEFGDQFIEAQCAKAFKTKKIEKGIAFPTCISVNECVAHFSPLRSESKPLSNGDIVKVDLGAHIDGFIAVAAQTVVIGADAATAPVVGPAADAIAAAHAAAEAAIRTIKPGNTNTQVSEVISRVASTYGVTPIAGQLSHNMKQWTIDGSRVILTRTDDPEHKVEEVTFEPNEVYSVDIAVSTGEGKPRELEARTTVLKRSPETTYMLKMKASRTLLTEVSRRFTVMPFTLRAAADESTARMGVVECLKHGVLQPYPVVFEKEGSFVAHVKFTVLLLPGGTLKVAGTNLPPYVASDKTAALPEDIKALLMSEPYQSKKAKKAAKKDEGDVEMK